MGQWHCRRRRDSEYFAEVIHHHLLQLSGCGGERAMSIHHRVEVRRQSVTLEHAMHQCSRTDLGRCTALSHHASSLSADGCASGAKHLSRLCDPCAWVAAVPCIAAPLQSVLPSACSVLLQPPRASREAVPHRWSSEVHCLCGVQQTSEIASLCGELKQRRAAVWWTTRDGKARKCRAMHKLRELGGEAVELSLIHI